MKRLADRIAAQKCPNHKQPYRYVYNGIVQNNERRMICEDCINPKNANRLINIQKSLRFLREQQIQEDKEIYQVKARLWQQFTRFKVQVEEGLKKVVAKINSINDNGVITTMIDELLGEQTIKLNIELIGEQLTKLIEQDNFGQYKIKQERDQDNQRVKRQLNFEQCIKKHMVPIYNQIQVPKLILNGKRIEQDVSNHIYQTIQLYLMQHQINSLCFNHDETQFIASVGNCICIFQISSQGQWIQREFSQQRHDGCIRKVRFNHNSTLIASCSQDKMIFIWNKQIDGKWCIQDKLSSHMDQVYSICFNRDSKLLASCSLDRTVQIHALSNSKWIVQHYIIEHTYMYDLCFNHNTTLLASASDIIKIWQLDTQSKWIVKQNLYDNTTQRVLGVKFNSDSTLLISQGWDATINIWSVNKEGFWQSNQTLLGHQDQILDAQINKQSNLIVSGSWDKQIKIWKLSNEKKWECSQTILQHNDIVRCTIISRDSTMIISGSGDKTIQVHKCN